MLFKRFIEEEKLMNVKLKNLMPLLFKKGYFKKEYGEGLPLRNVLRKLDDKDMFYLLPQVSVEHKENNRYWFFMLKKI
jgi:hypothetical protein